MARDTKPIKPKQTATMKQIEEALAKALRSHPECDGIRIEKVRRLSEPGAVANWDAEFEAEDGKQLTPDQRRVMLAAKLGVQEQLDLAKAE